MADSFPRQYARTQRLTLGEPRDLTVAPDGTRVIFARSRGGADPVNCLWVADAATGAETLIVDPVVLMRQIAVDDAELPPEERARRERMREGAGGITGYATDRDAGRVTFSLAGQLWLTDLSTGDSRHLDVPGPVFDPHLSPDGNRIAYVNGRELWVTDLEANATLLAGPTDDDPETVSWGSADFVAAEEMNRYRGFWWSPDGDTIAACRVDDAPVQIWHISNPADPGATPSAVRYPAAGTPNPAVTLHLCPLDGGDRTEVEWDHGAFEYLAKANWNSHGLAITVLSRDQRHLEVRTVVGGPSGAIVNSSVSSGSRLPQAEETTQEPGGAATGTSTIVNSSASRTTQAHRADESAKRTGAAATVAVFTDHDDAWVELVPGTGSLVAPGLPVMCADRDGTRRLMIGDEPVSPTDLQVRSVIDASAERVIVTGNPVDDPSQLHVHRWTVDGGLVALTDGLGVHGAAAGGDTIVLRSATVDEPGARWRLPNGETLDSNAERPLVRPNVRITTHTSSHTRTGPTTAVLLPHDHDGSPLPILLDPYGGPHAQRVVRSHNAFCASQWFADQGFAVVVADGRGTPGRGTSDERSVRHDLATGVLDDQVDALHAAADRHSELDLSRVAIRGWSFGGYLSALAVLQRPDVFHAAIAGAPVTEWRLYDTCYTERYLGDPNERPDVYDANSLLPLAPKLERPLLLIHGLADDNVVAAHTLQLSSALLAAGKPHEVLPLIGVTHMTPQEVVAENLLLHQLDFLRRALAR